MNASELLAAEVRRRRGGLGLTQQALADRAGLSRTEIVMVERGEGSPRLDTIVAIARSFGISASELVAPLT